ncbi:alpha/beta hydrolase family protein [Pelomonas sp. SE-A7]|uniref:dienelactone hydrolase family protein n=1 Tax=Pelomonas sp. SE-A7 TaxID=3054953 RepID=UPI00259CA5F5|nr:alpha/beta hydrolase family protein [Pelomonas sp. SE-A7]MDM4767299.1 alpha/beta hydrolase family protein [Pelomonas sp. SE-A7]
MLKPLLAAVLLLSLMSGGASAPPQAAGGLVGPEGSLPAFHGQLRSEMKFSLGWTEADKARPQAWQAAGLAKARELMMLPAEDATPFEPRVVDEIDRGSYVAHRIELSVSKYARITALMLVPKGAGPFPAALMLHDHGARFDIGKEKLVRPWGDAAREQAAQAWADRYFSGRFPGDELARRGHLVLVADALGWSDRSGPGFGRDQQQALAANLLNFGLSWAALIATEDLRLARFLATRPEVDRSRVSAIGFSMGAQRAWQLAALSDDVGYCIAVNWMAGLQGLMVPGNNQLKGQSAFAMLHPGLARYLDYPDVAALAAPKPALFYAGEQDLLFPPAAVAEAFSRLREVWVANSAGYRLETRMWPGGHQFTAQQQEAAFNWLERRQIKTY